ncbi:MAG: type II toxin-antitoxin system RelE/ParE family toxin [Rhizomicrobium sp.]
MRIYKTRWFVRYARQERIADSSLRDAIERAERGLIDADLGGGVIKQRVARPGRGRSGGYRTLIAFRRGDRAIFVFAFAKSDRENIDADELEALRETAEEWLSMSVATLEVSLDKGSIQEIRE